MNNLACDADQTYHHPVSYNRPSLTAAHIRVPVTADGLRTQLFAQGSFATDQTSKKPSTFWLLFFHTVTAAILISHIVEIFYNYIKCLRDA